MAYLLIKIRTQDGEHVHNTVHLHTTNAKDLEFAVHRYTASFWSLFSYRDGVDWFFEGGAIACRCTDWKELTKEEFEYLQKIIN